MSYLEGAEGASNGTLIQLFEESAQRFPKVPAIQTASHSITYRKLLANARKLAKRLNRNGIGVGDRVAIKLETGDHELYLAILGVLFSGAAYVPVDFEDSDERLGEIVKAAEVAAVITKYSIDYTKEGARSEPDVSPESDAWVIFTSGSTGIPKAVAVTHQSAFNLVMAERALFFKGKPLSPGSKVAATLSPAFDASIEEMWLAWSNGGTLVPISRETLTSGPDLPDALRTSGIEVLSTVPSIARFLVGADLSKLRLLILGGEALNSELAEALHRDELQVWNTYGPTETTIIATAAQLIPGEPVLIGLPINGSAIAVVNEEGHLVAFGDRGELVISGLGMGRYLDESIDSQKFRPLPALGWKRAYFTGDIVRVTEKGIEFIGRIDEQVKIGGKRIDLSEIEIAASSISGVKASSAVASQLEHGDYLLHCFLETTSDYSHEDFKIQLTKKLPAGINPVVRVVDSLPTKTSGKIDKSALLASLDSSTVDSSTNNPLLQDFRKVLGLKSFAESDNFFAHGGTSIKAAQLVVRLRNAFPMVTVADLYKNPTPKSLDEALGSKSNELATSESPTGSALGNWIKGALSLVLQMSAGLVLGAVALVLFSSSGPSNVALTFFELLGAIALFGAGLGRAVIAGLMVRLLNLGIGPGRYQKVGLTHIRIWLAERVCDLFSVAELAGSPWMVLFARITGSKVAKGCVIESLPPVLGNLELGSSSSIGRDVHVSGWTIQGGHLVVAGFKIGSHVRIGNRAFIAEGISVGSGAEIESGTLVSRDLEADQVVEGSPLEAAQSVGWPIDPVSQRKRWAIAYLLTPTLFGFTNLLQFLPAVFVIGLSSEAHDPGLFGTLIIAWAAVLGPVATLINALVTGILIRLASRRVRTGFHPIQSREGYYSWLVERLIQRSRRSVFWIYASVFTPSWAKLLGAKVGRNCEISTFNGQIGLVEIGDECFLADDVSIAARETKSGWVRLDSVKLEKRSFIGNSAHVRAGVTVRSGVLAGVASSVPSNNFSDSSFFGLPPLEFPRQIIKTETSLTYQPSLSLRAKRFGVEIFRLLPSALSLALLGLTFALAQTMTNQAGGFGTWLLVFAAIYVLTSYLAVILTAAAKWILVGRVRKSQHNLWTNFVWRNELVWNFVEMLAIPWTGAVAIDTPIQSHFFKLMGAKVGKNASIGTWFLDDPDLIDIGENATILKSADLQTHLFHDRIMQLDSVVVAENSVIGTGSFLLPGSCVGKNSTVSAGSLVPRDEFVPDNSDWLGNPIESR